MENNDMDEIKKMGEHLMGSKPKEKSSNPNGMFDMPKFDMGFGNQESSFFGTDIDVKSTKPTKSKPVMGGLASDDDVDKLAAMGRAMMG